MSPLQYWLSRVFAEWPEARIGKTFEDGVTRFYAWSGLTPVAELGPRRVYVQLAAAAAA